MNKKHNNKKLVFYNDRWLTIGHYKEPLKKIESKDGFGYYGALLSTIEGDLIQCHICGKLFKDLGKHIAESHKELSTREYREKYQLAYKTALCSEEERIRRQKTYLLWWNSLTNQEQSSYRKRWATARKKGLKQRILNGSNQPLITLETKNKRGVCPDQLLDKIKDVAKKLNHTPSLHEFIGETKTQRYKHLIFKTFGSWKKAIKMTGLSRRVSDKRTNFRRYSTEELLEYLDIFAEENRRIPTCTDFRRGLLPDYMTYIYRFGDIETARKSSNIYNILNIKGGEIL